MDILDIFSWLPEKEISLKKIKEIALDINDGKSVADGYSLFANIPDNANDNIVCVNNELISEGKKVCFLAREGIVIAAIGYH